MNNKVQCPICGNINNVIIENNSAKILKLKHPDLLLLNKELSDKFNTKYLCPICNLEFKYNQLTGYSVDKNKRIELNILSVIWSIIDKDACCQDSIENILSDKKKQIDLFKHIFRIYNVRLTEEDLLFRIKNKDIKNIGEFIIYVERRIG